MIIKCYKKKIEYYLDSYGCRHAAMGQASDSTDIKL